GFKQEEAVRGRIGVGGLRRLTVTEQVQRHAAWAGARIGDLHPADRGDDSRRTRIADRLGGREGVLERQVVVVVGRGEVFTVLVITVQRPVAEYRRLETNQIVGALAADVAGEASEVEVITVELEAARELAAVLARQRLV